MDEEKYKDGIIRRRSNITILLLVAIIFLLVFSVSSFFNMCDGEKRWSEYTGVLEFIDVENDICCHCYTRIKLYNQSWIRTVNCADSLEDIPLNESYTFYLEPFGEPYAITHNFGEPSCFWAQVVYRVVDVDDCVVWESRWW